MDEQAGFTKVTAIAEAFTCDICGAVVVGDPYRAGSRTVFEQHRAWHSKLTAEENR